MEQIIIKSQNLLTSVNEIMTKGDFKKCFLVCGKYFHKLNLDDILNSNNYQTVVFDNISPNPTYEQICDGIELFNNNSCDVILTIGGGSVLDVAKAIKLFHKMPTNDIPFFQQEFIDTNIPIIAIPTTAGTGSESTKYTILVYNNEKVAVEHNSILPNYAILNGAVMQNLSLYQKKCTLLDALAQAIESWWSVSSTLESIAYSVMSMQLIMKHYKEFLSDNSNDEVDTKIMLGSNYAGRAINITKTTAPHAMSYKLTTMKQTPHGHAVAVCLPEIWEFMYNNIDLCSDPRGSEHLLQAFTEISQMLNSDSIISGIKTFRDLLIELDIEKVTMTKDEITLISNAVNPSRLVNNPVPLSTQDIEQIYSAILL